MSPEGAATESVVPCVLCIDVEPDERAPRAAHGAPPLGFERLVNLEPALRARMALGSVDDPRVTWTLRLDPQIAILYGSPDWLATTYYAEFERFAATGDELGLHVHCWRRDDQWVVDHGDADWVAHCANVGLDGFHGVFGHPCHAYRHGDNFMSSALARQLDASGVRVDLTVYPGRVAAPGLAPGERTTGSIPDTRSAPHHAYRPSPRDFRAVDAARRSGLLMLPLTSAIEVSIGTDDGRRLPTGKYRPLDLWVDPKTFARGLRACLTRPDLSHLAFAIRSDAALLTHAWANVERNLDEIARVLPASHRWLTATGAAELFEAISPKADERPEPAEEAWRASLWLLGTDDPGYRERAEVEALAALERDEVGAATSEPVLRWGDRQVPSDCRVCGISGVATEIATVTTPWRSNEATVARCSRCRALALGGPPDAHPPLADATIDDYIESGGGIDAMLATLACVALRRNLRLLDVGCGYGLALDLARFLWDWDGVGLDPSRFAARGRQELELDIRTTAFGPDTDLGGQQFDVVLASEVIEHTPEPGAFLRALREHLAPGGFVVLSTPNAAIMDPKRPAREVVAALGLDDHTFLVDATGLDGLLRRSGYLDVAVDPDGDTLRAVASPAEDGLAGSRANAEIDLGQLLSYCDARADLSRPDSALHLGMAARAVHYAVAMGDYLAARDRQDRLRAALQARHSVDLDEPDATRRLAAGMPVAMVVAQAHHDVGLLELLDRGRPARAAAHFAAAAAAAHTNLAGPSAAPAWLHVHALGNEALAVARTDPAAAPKALERMRTAAGRHLQPTPPEVDVICGRVFTEIVAAGNYDAADAVRPLVVVPGTDTDHGDATPGAERSAIDTVFSLGMLALQRDRPAEAAAYFQLCATWTSRHDDPSARELGEAARRHERIAVERLVEPGRAPAEIGDDSIEASTVADESSAPKLVISAVIPVYEGRRYLADALASVLAQTMPPDELILVDDGSSDACDDLVDDLVAPFPVKVVHREHAGQSAARNGALEHARGEAIALLDQDDIWHPEHLATLHALMVDDPAVGWAYSDFDEIDGDGRIVTRAFLREQRIAHPRQTLAACLAQDLMVIPSASLIRRAALEAVGGFDEQLQGYEDDDLYVRMFRAGWRLAFEDAASTMFRVHVGSSSSSRHFGESRRRFAEKIRVTVGDDRRLNRFYYRDLIAPRFLRASVDDYVRAVSEKDWTTAREMWASVAYFAGESRSGAALRWKVEMIRNPRLLRWMLRANAALPPALRPTKNDAMRLR